MTAPQSPHLYRVVDTHNQGWLPTAAADGSTVYRADYGESRGLTTMPLTELERRRGPLRPVEPITDADEELLRETFRSCGRKAVATLAAAVEQVLYELRESKGGLDDPDSFAYAERTLKAGREGSWESECLLDVAWFGNALNLAPTKDSADGSIQARRAAGPSKRVDRAGREALAAMIMRWVSDPARYTEVAETLAEQVSGYADSVGPDGWKAVADQWLQPGALTGADFVACYRLLYSVSEHFDSDNLG